MAENEKRGRVKMKKWELIFKLLVNGHEPRNISRQLRTSTNYISITKTALKNKGYIVLDNKKIVITQSGEKVLRQIKDNERKLLEELKTW